MRFTTYIKRKVKTGTGIHLEFSEDRMPTNHKNFKDVLKDTLSGKHMLGYLAEWQRMKLNKFIAEQENVHFAYQGLHTYRTTILHGSDTLYLLVHSQSISLNWEMEFEYALWSQFLAYIRLESQHLKKAKLIWSIEEIVA